MAVNRFSSSFKAKTDVFDQITPNTKYSSDHIVTQAGEFRPAAWLPIVWVDAASDDAFVISSGKVVSMDTQGRIVPAGLRTRLLSGNLVYAQRDVDNGVVDLTTGERLTTTQSYAVLDVAKALVERGLVLETDISAVTAAEVIPRFISPPVGINQSDVYVWAGDTEADFKFTNYRKQHLVTFMTQVQMIVPHMVSANEASDSFDISTLESGGSESYVAGTFPEAGEYWDATNLASVNRYAAMDVVAATPVVALGLAHQPVARNTDRTPFGSDTAGVLVKERFSPTDIKNEGDWFLDADVGVLFLHSDTWATLDAAAATVVFDYDYYGTSTAAGDRYVHLDGRADPGDKVTFDADSNLVVADLSSALFYNVLGTVHSILVEPKGLLDRVRTAWNFSGVDKTFQMPGTATKGFSDLITLTDETVADRLAIVWISIK